MSRDNLRRWIEDPQHLKPGVRMPALGLSREELDAVVAYLGGSGER
jgi:cytochrome c oxidase subunit 2